MTVWQRRTRLALLVGAVAVAIAVAAAFKRRPAADLPTPLAPGDPKAVVESEGGWKSRFNRAHEEVRINYKTLTYPDNSAKLSEVKVTTIRAGWTSVITATRPTRGETDIPIHGDVRIVASDGWKSDRVSRTTDADAVIRRPGPWSSLEPIERLGPGTIRKERHERPLGSMSCAHETFSLRAPSMNFSAEPTN